MKPKDYLVNRHIIFYEKYIQIFSHSTEMAESICCDRLVLSVGLNPYFSLAERAFRGKKKKT